MAGRPKRFSRAPAPSFVQHDNAGARQQLNELLTRGIVDTNVVELLMKTYSTQNETAKGIERLRRVAAAKPDSAPLQQALGQ